MEEFNNKRGNVYYFFFSSRRRHTRYWRDWSSDVCSSDLGSPMLVLGGRAPAFRWGQGSLQEIDHVPFTAPVTKLARTAETTADIPALMDEALRVAAEAPTGPAFLDFPLDQVFMEADVDADAAASLPDPAQAPAADGDALDHAAQLLRGAAKPVVMAGTGLYWARGEEALVRLCEELQVPVFLNGLARGCVPADYANFFSRARGAGLKGADVALVIGVPMDLRLGFGGAFGDGDQVNGLRPAGAPRGPPALSGGGPLRAEMGEGRG